MKKISLYMVALLLAVSTFAGCSDRSQMKSSVDDLPELEDDIPEWEPEPELPVFMEEEEEDDTISDEDEEHDVDTSIVQADVPAQNAQVDAPAQEATSSTPSAPETAEVSEAASEASQVEDAAGAEEATSQTSTSTTRTLSGSLPEAFDFAPSNVVGLYARDFSDFAYVPATTSETVTEVVNLLKKAGRGEPEEIYNRSDGGFFVLLSDGSKYSYTLVLPSVRVGNDAYRVSEEDYQRLVSLSNQIIASAPSYVQWLCYMSPSRVSSISYYPASAESESRIPTANVVAAAEILGNLRVKKGTGTTYTEEKNYEPGAGKTIIQLTFDSGIVYKILIQGGMLYIDSNDMDYGCQYQLETSTSSIVSALNALV